MPPPALTPLCCPQDELHLPSYPKLPAGHSTFLPPRLGGWPHLVQNRPSGIEDLEGKKGPALRGSEGFLRELVALHQWLHSHAPTHSEREHGLCWSPVSGSFRMPAPRSMSPDEKENFCSKFQIFYLTLLSSYESPPIMPPSTRPRRPQASCPMPHTEFPRLVIQNPVQALPKTTVLAKPPTPINLPSIFMSTLFSRSPRSSW